MLLLLATTTLCRLPAESVPAKYKQGSAHGFLVLKTLDGKVIAVGDHVSSVRANGEVHSRLTFRFHDGSLDDEQTVYRQGSAFQLVSDHHIQKGPSFPDPLDLSIYMPKKQIRWREAKNDTGKITEESEQDLPSDLANGLIGPVLENFPHGRKEVTVPFLTGTAKPHIVRLVIRPGDDTSFAVAGVSRPAKQFIIHVDIGGIGGMVAPLLGKQPVDYKMSIVPGDAPSCLRMEGQLYLGGPVWIAEMAAPVWTQLAAR